MLTHRFVRALPPEPPSPTAWLSDLARLGPCGKGLTWAQSQPSPEAAWAACPRPEWLLWLLIRLAKPGSAEHRRLVALGAVMVRTVSPLVGSSYDPEPLLRALERWAAGEDTAAEVQALHAVVEPFGQRYATTAEWTVAQALTALAAMAGPVGWETLFEYGRVPVSMTVLARTRLHNPGPREWFAVEEKERALLADLLRQHVPSPPDLSRRPW